MPDDRFFDDAGARASEKAAPRPRRRLFALLGFAWLALGIAWLIVALTGSNSPAEPWRIVLGVLYLVLGMGFIIGWLRGRRSASESIR
jgi:O-antigen/teichoic acid export membrane protein